MYKSSTDCKYFTIGSCQRGNNCGYRHSLGARNAIPCRYWLRHPSKCMNGPACDFSHPNLYSKRDKEEREESDQEILVNTLLFVGKAGYKLVSGAYSWWNSNNNNITKKSEPAIEANQQPIRQVQKEQKEERKERTYKETKEKEQEEEESENENPFLCPITMQIMSDPVITPHGICFERKAIMAWLKKSDKCPITNNSLTADQLVTCYVVKNAIDQYNKMRVAMEAMRISERKSISTSSISQSIIDSSSPSLSLSSSSSSSPSSSSSSSSSSFSSLSVSSSPSSSSSPSPSPTSSSSSSSSSSSRSKSITIDVPTKFTQSVKIWEGSKLCSEDNCILFPALSSFIILPPSTNYLFSRSTGYVVIRNDGDFEVMLVSREREATLWDPKNNGGKKCAKFLLSSNTEQGFDFRGYYCIEVKPDKDKRPIRLSITDFSLSGGEKGAWLKMGTEQ